MRLSNNQLGALVALAFIAIVVEGLILAATGNNTCAACVSTPTGKY